MPNPVIREMGKHGFRLDLAKVTTYTINIFVFILFRQTFDSCLQGKQICLSANEQSETNINKLYAKQNY